MLSQLETPALNSRQETSPSANQRLVPAIEGLVQVFTCEHRSFFTNVMSQALRLAGQGTTVLIVQFLKGGIGQGHLAPVRLGQHLDWIRCNLPRCIDAPDVDPHENEALQQLWQHTQDVVCAGKYSLVVLDELSLAIGFGLIPEAEVLDFLNRRPRSVDIIFTGPGIPQALLAVADQITEVRRSHRP